MKETVQEMRWSRDAVRGKKLTWRRRPREAGVSLLMKIFHPNQLMLMMMEAAVIDVLLGFYEGIAIGGVPVSFPATPKNLLVSSGMNQGYRWKAETEPEQVKMRGVAQRRGDDQTTGKSATPTNTL